MGKLDYIADGQMSLFDFIEPPKKEVSIKKVAPGALFRYLRYGPHTLVPEARDECKAYLDSLNGVVPDDMDDIYHFSKGWSTLPCGNCEHEKGGVCMFGGHTCHYEYEKYLVCDAFKQTIDAKPKLEKPICQYSNHSCNKENLWEVAEMDGGQCNRVCCRQCDFVGCGARCNGSEEPKREEPQQSTEVTKKTCSNCLRFNMDIEQPPEGWGHIGYCVEHHEKCNDISYCSSWDPKPVEVITYSANEYVSAIVKHLIDHCRTWGMSEKIKKLREEKTTDNFHRLFCKVTRTYFVPLGELHLDVEFCKDNAVNIKRCGRDYNDRPLDATIQLQEVLEEL